MRLTPHFTVEELSTTSTGLANTPSAEAVERLRCLAAAVLEPWRERVGALRVNSGYRSPAVNRAVGGSSTSQHLLGEAADLVPLSMALPEAWAVLVELARGGVPVDQAVVYERPPGRGWVHVSHTTARDPRRQLLVQPADRPGLYVPWRDWSGALVLPG